MNFPLLPKVFFNTHTKMDIFGQGPKIMLFAGVPLVAAVWFQLTFPQAAALPESLRFIQPAGYLLLGLGLQLWGTAVIQLLRDFPKGKLVTSGAYRVVRNPIYASVAVLILPAITLITFTWVYLLVSVVMIVGVNLFIGKEEEQLRQAFGQEYEAYMSRVDRIIPFKKP